MRSAECGVRNEIRASSRRLLQSMDFSNTAQNADTERCRVGTLKRGHQTRFGARVSTRSAPPISSLRFGLLDGTLRGLYGT